MLSDLGIYVDFLEPLLLSETEKFYQMDGSNHIDSLSVPEYLLYIERRLSEESDRVHEYLCESSKRYIIEILEKELLVAHLSPILNKGNKSYAGN